MGSHLQHPHSDAHRLTSSIPKMILITYKTDVHPGEIEGAPNCPTFPSHCAQMRIRIWAALRRGSGHVSEPRLWWQDVMPSDWTAFLLPEDLVRERYTALLAALEELSTRGRCRPWRHPGSAACRGDS